MRMFLLIAAFAIAATAAQVLTGQGGGGGAGFSCDVNNLRCSCTGKEDGADCQAMKKNCKGPLACDSSECVCVMAMKAPKPTRGASMSMCARA